MKNCILLTDIPAPYRIEFYNYLNKKFDFEVYYMQSEVFTRPGWFFDEKSMKHKYLINNGFFKKIGRFNVFFNPNLIRKILFEQPKNLILALAWNDLDVLLICLLKRLGIIKSKLTFWSEANHMTIGASNDNFFKYIIRKFVYNCCDVQISSGKMTEITFIKWGFDFKKYIPLPNTIEQNKYTISNIDINKRYAKGKKPVFLISARLIENVKGVLNFLESLDLDDLKSVDFLIAGEGPDKKIIELFISKNNLKNIRLLGQCSTHEMIDLYKRVNCLCLPSYSDPSPLSLIEACKMHLPILVSERCGNHFEVLENGKNGYIFNPKSKTSIKSTFKKFLKNQSQWKEMGDYGFNIYNNTFERELVIDNFVKYFNKYMKCEKN